MLGLQSIPPAAYPLLGSGDSESCQLVRAVPARLPTGAGITALRRTWG